MKYYNYKLCDLNNLKQKDLNWMIRAMNINEARDQMLRFEAEGYSSLKRDDRKKLHRKYSKIAFPDNFKKKNVVKFSDLKNIL